MTRDEVLHAVPGLPAERLDLWVARAWVRPDEGPIFADIDVARVRLLVVLQDDMEIEPASVPVVLSLLDQLYDARRQMRLFREALETVATADQRAAMAELLRRLSR